MYQTCQTRMIEPGDHPLENQRNRLLILFHDRKHQQASRLLGSLLQEMAGRVDFRENDIKCLNQILVMARYFTSKPAANIPSTLRTRIKSFSKSIAGITRSEIKKNILLSFEDWQHRAQVPEQLFPLLFKTLINLQLNTGCSHYCRRCNEWALPGVRRGFSFEAVRQFCELLRVQHAEEISLYAASDPLDWQDHEKTISDIVALFESYGISYALLSKVPKKSQAELIRLVENKKNISVSLTDRNRHRIEKLKPGLPDWLGFQHDTDDLLIPAGLDEDFTSVKSSITDNYGTEITPDGAFIIIPTFTSALHPVGHQKIPITQTTGFFPQKKTGRHALLVDYFKPLKGFDPDMNSCILDRLLDVQVESILLDSGSHDLTPPGMRSLNEYLDIFDPPAIQRRKAMTLSVMQHLKEQFLSGTSYASLSTEETHHYRKQIRRHLDLSRPGLCQAFRTSALSYFLKYAAAYCRKFPVKVKIIRKLLETEIQDSINNFKNMASGEIVEIMRHAAAQICFSGFRHALFCLLLDPDTAWITEFILAYPSVYDPQLDLFVDGL